MNRVSPWAWAALLWVGVIFFSSTSLASRWAETSFDFISGEFLRSLRSHASSLGLIHLLADKGFHVSLFCVLALLLWLAFGTRQKKAWIILITGAVVGSISEFLQRFFPDRDPALRDVLINTAGTALGIAICLLVAKWRTPEDAFIQPETRFTSSSPR